MSSSDIKETQINLETDISAQNLGSVSSATNPTKEEQGAESSAKEQASPDLYNNVSEELSKTWFEKYFCCLNFLREHFNVSSEDFVARYLNALIPFNVKFKEIKDKSPDLYGPFWIYTTLIIVVSATGSLVRFIQGNSSKNFFIEFVPIAALIIYVVGFGLPITITILMKSFGTLINFVPLICTYGYSWGIYIPISVICVAPYQWLQWIVLSYGAFSSTSLLVVNYYKEVASYTKYKKYIIVGLVLFFQIGVFVLFNAQ